MRNLLINISQTISSNEIDVPKPALTNDTIGVVVRLVLGIFAGIAVLVISIGALKMVMSRGNPQEVARARDTIIYAAVGLVISMAAFIIVSFVVDSI